MAGVAGVGMSALAQLLLARGSRVTGSDRYADGGGRADVLVRLQRAGLHLLPQDGRAIEPRTQALIVSTAIEPDNVEMLAAGALGVPVFHRAEVLARCCAGSQVVAVAGTSGKTTVTGLVGWLLEQGGLDPCVVNGGSLIDWTSATSTGSVRASDSGLWVIEADESDRSLLHFTPRHAIITNISHDHFPLGKAVDLFQRFAGQVTGRIVCPPSVAGQLALPEGKALVMDDACVRQDGEGWCFDLAGRTLRVCVPGRHNAVNALLAAGMAGILGMMPEAIEAGLHTFGGIHRRLETKGFCRGARVVDDYAHNPEKMCAAWSTLKEAHAPVSGLWRPHGYRPLAVMRESLLAMFQSLVQAPDVLHVLPVYYAGGRTQAAYAADAFVADLRERGVPAVHVADYAEARERLLGCAEPGSAILVMGARDPELPRFAEQLATIP